MNRPVRKSSLFQLIESYGARFGVRDHLPKFLFVGFLGIGVDVFSFLLITRFILSDILTAQVFSFTVAVTHNFTLNKLWTFEDKARKETRIQYLKFLVVALYALGLRSGVIAVCLRCGLPALLSLLIGIGSGTAVNFIGSREWAFAPGKTLRPRTTETPVFLLWAFIVFLFLVRLVYSSIMDLAPEEAYYWNYAIHPALSYFDHPPMVAWVISIGTFLLGKTEVGVRIVGILLTMGSTSLVYSLGKMWFDKRSGLWAALLFQAVPIYFIYGFTTTPDVPLIFFWLMTMYWVSLCLLREKTWAWYAAGLTLGCSMLSKYTGVFLVPCTFLFLLWNRGYRKWLWKKEPYLAIFLSLLVLSPVIVWNYQHDWASFSFQFSQRLSKSTSHPLVYFLRFVGSQMGVVFPTFFLGLMLVLVISLRKSVRGVDPKWKYALSYALPLLAFLIFYSTKSEVKVNWTLPAYLPLFMAAYPCYRYLCRRTKGMRRGVIERATALSIFLLPLIYVSVLYHIGIGIPSLPNMTKLGGWRELGSLIEKEEAAMKKETGKDPFLTGMSKYHLAAELAFYTADPHDTFSSNVFGGPGLGFEYWTDKNALRGRDGLILSKGPPNIDFLKNFFAKVDGKVRPITVMRQGKTMHTFYVVRCYGYRG